MGLENAINDAELAARAFAFALEARRFALMSDLAEAVKKVIAPLDLTAAASGLVSGPKAASANPFHFANWPHEWLTRYAAERFLLVDPTPRWARNSGVALTWSDLFQRLPARDRGRKVIETGARFGFTEGMVVPMRSGDNSLGLVSFGGRRGALDQNEQVFLTLVAREAFEAAERIEHKGDTGRPAPILSARELECIVLVVRGHTDREIGELLGLSHPTVRFHLANAREKAGAVSRTHLAALAVAQGYVTL